MQFMHNGHLPIGARIAPETSNGFRIPVIRPNVYRSVRAAMRAGTRPGVGRAIEECQRFVLSLAMQPIIGCNAVKNTSPFRARGFVIVVSSQCELQADEKRDSKSENCNPHHHRSELSLVLDVIDDLSSPSTIVQVASNWVTRYLLASSSFTS